MIEDMQGMEPDELRELAAKLNVTVHHRAGKPTLIAAIAEKMAEDQKSKQPTVERVVEEIPELSYGDVLENKSIKAIMDAKPEFQVRYDDEDNCITFRYKGAEECINLGSKMKHIVQKAQNVARGSLRLRAYGESEGFDSSVGKGYAKNVLM